jgi:hypothetical protein
MDEIAKNADYPGKYQVISMDKLNELILSSKELFYYVSLYSGHDTSTGIVMNSMTVTNGLTGDIIFKDYVLTRDSFSPPLFKTLSKLIQKLNK